MAVARKVSGDIAELNVLAEDKLVEFRQDDVLAVEAAREHDVAEPRTRKDR